MSMPRIAVLVVSVVLAVVLATSSVREPAHAVTSQPQRCSASQLRGGVYNQQGATGAQAFDLRIRNAAHTACTLAGPFRLVRLGPLRKPLPLQGNTQRLRRTLTLQRGWHLEAVLELRNGCGRHGELFARFGAILFPLHVPPEGRCDSPGKPPYYGLGAPYIFR
jgi:hypothetical protein